VLECETWYEFGGGRHNEQRFAIPREELASLRHAVAAVRRRNAAFHFRLRRSSLAIGRPNPVREVQLPEVA
jgi:hypothetical protein